MKKRFVNLFFMCLALGFCTEIQAQTNAVLNYPAPVKRGNSRVSSVKAYSKCDTCKHDSAEKKIQKGLNTIGQGMDEFMQRESKAMNKIAKDVEKGGKKFFQKITKTGNKIGKGVEKTLNNVSDAISNHQIKNKKKK